MRVCHDMDFRQRAAVRAAGGRGLPRISVPQPSPIPTSGAMCDLDKTSSPTAASRASIPIPIHRNSKPGSIMNG